MGIHPPGNDCGGCSRFWGIQLQEGAEATTFIYNWNRSTTYNWVNETIDGVTYGYSSYGDRALQLYDENATSDDPTPYSYWGTAWGYPDSNASGNSTSMYDFVFVQPNQYNFGSVSYTHLTLPTKA